LKFSYKLRDFNRFDELITRENKSVHLLKKRKNWIRVIIVFVSAIVIGVMSWYLFSTEYTTETEISFDENGIILRDYGFKQGHYIGEHRNPVVAGQYALQFYEDFIQTGNETAKQYLINNADWFLQNVEKRDDYSIYVYDFPWPYYNMPEGEWVDAMAQTRMMMVLIRAHEITGDEEYLREAYSLLNALFVEVKDGGVTYKSENGWWFEHFAHPGGYQPRVLNAHLRVLMELDEFIKYTDSESAKFLFDKGLEAATKEIQYYDLNGYSYVNRIGDPSQERYHKIHIEETKHLYEITGEKVFLEYHDRWLNCDFFCKNWNYYYQYSLRKMGLT